MEVFTGSLLAVTSQVEGILEAHTLRRIHTANVLESGHVSTLNVEHGFDASRLVRHCWDGTGAVGSR